MVIADIPAPGPSPRLGGCHLLITEAPAIFILIYHHHFVMSAVINRTDQQTKASFLSSAVIIRLLL